MNQNYVKKDHGVGSLFGVKELKQKTSRTCC